tara:strand:- start:20 stop:181 length:162 start_codon:yes stop_codon:yes gene_type:complete
MNYEIANRETGLIKIGLDHLIEIIEADPKPDLELIQDLENIKAIFMPKGKNDV